MNILGIETSGPVHSVGVKTDTGFFLMEGADTARSSRTLVADCESVVQQAGLIPRDIEGVAVDLGPGSFTGLRIGCTAAKSIAWSLGIGVAGISGFQAIAAYIADKKNEITIAVISDARMNEVNVGLYAGDEDGRVQETFLGVLSRAEAEHRINTVDIITGPDQRFLNEFDAASRSKQNTPGVSFIIAETKRTSCFGNPLEKDITPLYLKESEPERQG